MSADIKESTSKGTARRPSGGGVLGPVLAGVGALLLVVGGMVYFYAVPKLAVAPANVNSTTHLQATNAMIFDTGTLKPITTDLAVENRTVGDAEGTSKAPAHTIVWASMTTTRSSDGVIRSQSTSSTAMNDKTAQAVDCCGNFDESADGTRTPTHPTGLVYKFPFDTAKQTYQVWDDTLGKAVVAKYAGTTSIQGMTVYKFTSDVPATVVGQESLPASVFGLPGSGNVAADSYYQNATTQYVEPTTGAIINRESQLKQWYSAQGHDLVTTEANLAYTPQTVSTYVHDYRGKASMLSLASGPVPWLVMVLGLVLIGGGVAAARRSARLK
jgi:hypothetical protein